MQGKRKQNDGRQSDQRSTIQVRVDRGWHKEFKVLAAKHGKTIRELVEEGYPANLEAYEGVYDN